MLAATKLVYSHEPGLAPGEHVIGAFTGEAAGPTLIVIGGLHGNEPAGVEALFRVSAELAELEAPLRGRAYFLAGNTRALLKGERFIDRDLNRHWTSDSLAAVGTPSLLWRSEGRELTELDRLLDGILITARSEVYVLDLHSTSAGGAAFATVGDTLRNRRFAQKFPVTILLGIEEQLDGTMLEHLNNLGAVTMGFEGGQHESPLTVENHVSLVWLALVNAGIIAAADASDLEAHRLQLSPGRHVSRIVEIRYREPIAADDEFQMEPGIYNFDPVTEGQLLGENRRGPILARESGMVLMPLYQKQGDDGFFIGRRVAPIWLWLSQTLREWKIPALMHWLPGVKRDPANNESLIVNTRVARLFPLQIFHLLGYRKRRWQGAKLVVSRRRHDTDSPFVDGEIEWT